MKRFGMYVAAAAFTAVLAGCAHPVNVARDEQVMQRGDGEIIAASLGFHGPAVSGRRD
jgi:hypothetical protein